MKKSNHKIFGASTIKKLIPIVHKAKADGYRTLGKPLHVGKHWNANIYQLMYIQHMQLQKNEDLYEH